MLAADLAARFPKSKLMAKDPSSRLSAEARLLFDDAKPAKPIASRRFTLPTSQAVGSKKNPLYEARGNPHGAQGYSTSLYCPFGIRKKGLRRPLRSRWRARHNLRQKKIPSNSVSCLSIGTSEGAFALRNI